MSLNNFSNEKVDIEEDYKDQVNCKIIVNGETFQDINRTYEDLTNFPRGADIPYFRR